MSMETDLATLLTGLCARTYPDVAPANVARPYVTWQQLGGESLRYADNAPMDKRYPLLQINVWSDTRLQSTALIRQIEDALCASAAFTSEPQGEPASIYEEDTKLYGSIQRFTLFAAR
jgi:hypothetical protein